MLQAAARRGGLRLLGAPHRPSQALIDASGAQRLYSAGIDGARAGVQTAETSSPASAPKAPAVLQLHSDEEVQTALNALGGYMRDGHDLRAWVDRSREAAMPEQQRGCLCCSTEIPLLHLTRAGAHGLAILDFTAVWCPPCKMIAPLYEQLAASHPAINFYKVDIDGEAVRGTVLEQAVSSVPTFVSYRGGKRLDQFSGADRAALQLMVDALSSAAA